MSSPIPAALTPFARADDDETTVAARGLEAHFLRQLLAEVRGTAEGGLLDGGFAGSTFREMLDGALADRMAQGGGIGIAKLLQKQLARSDGALKDPQTRSK
jgi:flagellar protein FlgJ